MARAKMSYKKFFEVLAEVAAKPSGRFEVSSEDAVFVGPIRQKRRVKFNDTKCVRQCCPIEAVYRYLNGKSVSYYDAAAEMGLDKYGEIAGAADNCCITHSLEKLRRRMLKAVNLQDSASV